MTFQPGKSGNPKGRPKKGKALTDILEQAGSKSIVLPNGKTSSGKRFIAQLLWCAATTGACTFPGGREVILDDEGWVNLVQWLYTRIDGAPKQSTEMDLTSSGEPLAFLPLIATTDVETT